MIVHRFGRIGKQGLPSPNPCRFFLLVLLLSLWVSQMETVRSTMFSRGRNSTVTTTTTTPPPETTTTTSIPINNDAEYDDDVVGNSDRSYDDIHTERSAEYIYDLMESLMMTIHEKLRRAETLENTCKSMLDRMSQRLDTMEDKFDYHNNRIDVAVNKLRSIDTKLLQLGGPGAGSIDIRLQTLSTKVDSLGTKLAELKDDFIRDKRGTMATSTSKAAAVGSITTEGDLAAQSSERRDFIKDKSGKNVQLVQPDNEHKVTKDIESVKDTLANLDSRIQYWMQQVSTTANGIAQTIGDLHDAIMEPSPSLEPAESNETASVNGTENPQDVNASVATASSSSPVYQYQHGDEAFIKETKLDKLFRKIHPILRATEKMDEMWNVVLGTQRLVDDSLQKSDQLLTNSYRQVQSLSDVKEYLQHQTDKIMQNLEQVEEWLKEQGTATANIDPKVLTQGIKDILNKTAHLRELGLHRPEMPHAMERSSDNDAHYHHQHEAEAYHRDNEYAHDPRRSQALEPKSVTVSYSVRNSTLPLFKRKSTRLATVASSKNSSDQDDLCPLQGPPGTNCADLRHRGVTKSGVYYILIKGTTYWFMKVYCDMDTDGGGWTVIQRRDDFGHPRENFIRDWTDYKNGFGDMKREFWLGNENVFMLTNQEDYALRVDLEDFDSHKRYALYSKFKICSEAENYKLEIGGYEGNAADSLNDPWYGSNLSPFSTYDRDNDRSSLNCASMLRGGWWWRSCGRGLNGIYLTNPTDLAARQGIVWFRWRGWDYTLKRARMAIRPKSFVPPAKG